jgi:acetyl-CoA/propionyl-CoA carboxylase biotin carboxyl carrier protein
VLATIHPAAVAGPPATENAAEDTIEEAVIALGAAD